MYCYAEQNDHIKSVIMEYPFNWSGGLCFFNCYKTPDLLQRSNHRIFVFIQNQNVIVLKTFRCEIRTQFPITIISYLVVQRTLKLYLIHFCNYFCYINFDPSAQITALMVIKGCFRCKSFHHTKLENITVQSVCLK